MTELNEGHHFLQAIPEENPPIKNNWKNQSIRQEKEIKAV